MKKKEASSSQTKLEDLFTPPSPASPPTPAKVETPPASPAKASPRSLTSSKEDRKAALKEKRKQEKLKEKEEKEKEKERKKKAKMASSTGEGSKAGGSERGVGGGSKGKHKPSRGKKGTEPEEEDFRTMIVNPGRENQGEFKEYLPPPEPKGFPTKEEVPPPPPSFILSSLLIMILLLFTWKQLSHLSRNKLKEADKGLEGERDAQVLAIKYKYAEQKMMIIDNLIEKEITAIADKVPCPPPFTPC